MCLTRIVVTDETTSADIEDWDSLTHITLIAEVESAFSIKFSMKAVLDMKNVGEMADLIEKAWHKPMPTPYQL